MISREPNKFDLFIFLFFWRYFVLCYLYLLEPPHPLSFRTFLRAIRGIRDTEDMEEERELGSKREVTGSPG